LHVTKKKTFNNPHPNALWYLDKKDTDAASVDEIKAREERLMLQAMGVCKLMIVSARIVVTYVVIR